MIRFDRISSIIFKITLEKSRFLSASKFIPILMYHSISDEQENGVSSYYKINTSPLCFRSQMQYLHENNYKVVGIKEVFETLNNNCSNIDKAVAITFDDGYKDFLTNAWPVLEKFGHTATVFLPTKFIGESSRNFNKRECLTWSEVRKLHGHGINFGSHTVNHPMLYGKDKNYIRQELRDSRATIERQLDSPIDMFSYPYAFPQEDQSFVSLLREELNAAGYKAGVTTAIGRVNRMSDPLTLKRLPINTKDDLELFKAKLNGAYDWMALPQKLVRNVKIKINRRNYY